MRGKTYESSFVCSLSAHNMQSDLLLTHSYKRMHFHFLLRTCHQQRETNGP